MVCLPAEFKASLDLRRPAPAKGRNRGCPPPRGATVKAIDSAALGESRIYGPNILARNRRLGDVENQCGRCGVSRELRAGLGRRV
jgi:hypothetical protein